MCYERRHLSTRPSFGRTLSRRRLISSSGERPSFVISCIAPGFKQFEEWLISVWKQLGLGSIKRQEVATQPMLSVWPIDERLYPAIKATLGGQVTYWTFMRTVHDPTQRGPAGDSMPRARLVDYYLLHDTNYPVSPPSRIVSILRLVHGAEQESDT